MTTTKKAKDLEAGDKVKAGEMIAEVESTRMVNAAPGSPKMIKIIKIAGQPEIKAWNLQKYIDQGSIEII